MTLHHDHDLRSEPRAFSVADDRATEAAPWAAAVDRYRQGHAEDDRLGDICHAIDARIEEEAPTPPALRSRSGGVYLTEEGILGDHRLSLSGKADAIEALRAWAPLLAAARERHGFTQAHEVWEAHDGIGQGFETLVDTPAPTLEAVVFKVRTILAEVACQYLRQNVDEPDTISELLSESHYDSNWPMARVYQDLLRLTQMRPELVAAGAFDAEAWVKDFEALPGHRITPWGPAYVHPDAWPVDRASDAEVTITDPLRLIQLAQDRAERTGEPVQPYDHRGVQLGEGCMGAVERIYADDPAERDQLTTALRSRMAPPQGSAQWRALPEWRREHVQSWAASRAKRTPTQQT